MLSVKNICKSYGELEVLSDIDCQFEKGRLSAIVGPNGAGKSTLLNIMGRLISADAGTVELYGRLLATWRERELARELSILCQSSNININISVEELTAMGRFPYSGGVLTPTDRDHIEQALDITELKDIRHKSIVKLSGGQRQRAFIAMVIAQDSDYILLDEPLNNLDMRHGLQIMELLRHLSRDHGKAIILVMHDINLAAAFADDMYAISDRVLFYAGDSGSFINEKRLAEVFGVDFEILKHKGRSICLYY